MAQQKFGALAFSVALMAGEQYKMQKTGKGSFFTYECNQSEDLPAEPRRAICIMDSQPNETGKGVVLFEQANSFARTLITGTFSGLIPGNKHGFHIH